MSVPLPITPPAIPGYRLERPLGRGGMAMVYLAVQESLERQVALKVMHARFGFDVELSKRFLHEGRMVARLTHPHIIKVFDTGVHQGQYFIAMEYLAGGDLKSRLRHGGLAPLEAIRIAKCLMEALTYAHGQNIIHRDIKPQNILFYPSGIPVLSDFGIAKWVDSSIVTATNAFLGSPRYMSPEQINGAPPSVQGDLYAMGVMFHEMLTGQVPYVADSLTALAMKHLTAPLPKLEKSLHLFQPLIDGLMAKQPEERFADAAAVWRTLEAIELQYRQMESGTHSKVKEPVEPRSSRRVWLSLAAMGLAASGIASYYYIANLPDGDVAGDGQPAVEQVEEVVAIPTVPQTGETTPRDSAADYLARGQWLLGQEQWDAALAMVDEGLGTVPDDPRLLALRAVIADRQERQLAEARAARDQALAQLFDTALAQRDRGEWAASLATIDQALAQGGESPEWLNLRQEIQAAQEAAQRREAAWAQALRQGRALLIEQRFAAALEAVAGGLAQGESAELLALRQEIQAAQEAAQRRETAWAQALRQGRALLIERRFAAALEAVAGGLAQGESTELLALRDSILAAQEAQRRAAKAEAEAEAEAETAAEDALAQQLATCETHLAANRLTTGRSGSALVCYREVLAQDPDNTAALAGLEAIINRYGGWIESNLARNRLDRAELYWQRLTEVDRDHPMAVALRRRLDQAQAEAEEAQLAAERQRQQVLTRQAQEAEEQRQRTEALERQRRQEQARQQREAELQRQQREAELQRQQREAELQRQQVAAAKAPPVSNQNNGITGIAVDGISLASFERNDIQKTFGGLVGRMPSRDQLVRLAYRIYRTHGIVVALILGRSGGSQILTVDARRRLDVHRKWKVEQGRVSQSEFVKETGFEIRGF
ncbi:MAG: protein kinase [Candidatus Competibacterales bacterium]